VDYRLIVSTGYKILETAKYKINVSVGSGDITSYEDTGYPADGRLYFWWVWAYAADGSLSVWSEVSANARYFRNTEAYIGAPALVSPANGASVAGSSVLFDWTL